jgi:hypothetical protein
MLNAPALIVRHRRYTLVIGILLTCLMAVASIALSLALHRAGAALAVFLAPLIFVLMAAGLLRLAYDRWSKSLVSLRVAAEGLSLPGLSARRIPWTDVRSVRCIDCRPTAEHGGRTRQYLLFEVNMPTISRIGRPGFLWWRAQELVLDVGELDTSKDVILEAVYRFYPAAVADAEVGRKPVEANKSQGVRLRLPIPAAIRFCAQCIRAEAASLLADCKVMWSAAAAAWHRLAPKVRREARLVMLGAAIAQRITIHHAQSLAAMLRDVAMPHLERGHRTVRVAAIVIRHRLVRSA